MIFTRDFSSSRLLKLVHVLRNRCWGLDKKRRGDGDVVGQSFPHSPRGFERFEVFPPPLFSPSLRFFVILKAPGAQVGPGEFLIVLSCHCSREVLSAAQGEMVCSGGERKRSRVVRGAQSVGLVLRAQLKPERSIHPPCSDFLRVANFYYCQGQGSPSRRILAGPFFVLNEAACAFAVYSGHVSRTTRAPSA